MPHLPASQPRCQFSVVELVLDVWHMASGVSKIFFQGGIYYYFYDVQ